MLGDNNDRARRQREYAADLERQMAERKAREQREGWELPGGGGRKLTAAILLQSTLAGCSCWYPSVNLGQDRDHMSEKQRYADDLQRQLAMKKVRLVGWLHLPATSCLLRRMPGTRGL